MRGNHWPAFLIRFFLGSIPAHAGKPRPNQTERIARWVYPRACGETVLWGLSYSLWEGLSPRMRGNLYDRHPDQSRAGSIPAHAGKPALLLPAIPRSRVYPRACGETMLKGELLETWWGLSPRMRGNLTEASSSAWITRSIPAHAGKPQDGRALQYVPRVYPRACGETMAKAKEIRRNQGLSPRMRGNLQIALANGASAGSIPAHAGKPGHDRQGYDREGVYPRACGETICREFGSCFPRGLSPRMRGNPGHATGAGPARGSIPAHAGKPQIGLVLGYLPMVYPRACGET